MEIPDKCKKCAFFKDINETKDNNFGCTLGHSITTALGCPNQQTENKYI